MSQYADVFFKGKQPSQNCLFCSPNAGMTIYETDNFRLMADTYPIIPGHLMISSKEHYNSAGEVAIHLYKELSQLKSEAKNIALEIAGFCIFYEHGKAGACHAHSLDEIQCEHFHLHCLPILACIHKKIANKFHQIKIRNYAEVFYQCQKYGSYLFFENDGGEMAFYPAETHKVPPHYLRTLICKQLKIQCLADWQNYSDLNRYLISRELISNALVEETTHAVL